MNNYNLPLYINNEKEILLCINTHIINTILPITFNTIIVGVLFGFIDSIKMLIASISVFYSQYFSRDFVILKKNDYNQYTSYKKNKDKLTDYYIYGKPIYSIGNGTVIHIKDGINDEIGSNIIHILGNHVIVKYSDTLYAIFAHMKKNSIKVKKNDNVISNQVLGEVGCSGNSGEPHLHFQLSVTNPITIPAVGILSIPKRVNIFSSFKYKNLLGKDESELVFDLKASISPIISLIDFEKIINNIDNLKIRNTNELPHLGIIVEKKR